MKIVVELYFKNMYTVCVLFLSLKDRIRKNLSTVNGIRPQSGALPGIATVVRTHCFMVLGLTFKSVKRFELILVYGIRRWSSFIFLHVSDQFSQHRLLNRLSLAHCVCFLPLPNIN